MSETVSQKPRFTVGQQVRVDAAFGRQYPRRARGGAIGVISTVGRLVSGVRRYDVYYQDAAASGMNPKVRVEEGHLQAVASPAPEPTQDLTQEPESDAPRFAKGEHVIVDPRSELAYETFTRTGAVGVIMRVGKPVRGIRRYDVLFEVPHLGGRRASRIREEHLLPVIAELDGKGIGLVSVTPVYATPEPVVTLQEHDDGTVTLRERKHRLTQQWPAGRAYCAAAPAGDHGWQAWDSRYRRCRFCGDVERLPVKSEVAR